MLQPLNGESFKKSNITDDEERVDISARSEEGNKTFKQYTVLKKEKKKKRKYNNRILEVDMFNMFMYRRNELQNTSILPSFS